jgi:hypothetical protein
MPTLYSLCDTFDTSVEKLAKSLIQKHHPDVSEADVLIEYAFAEAEKDKNGDPIGRAIVMRGYAKAGYCQIIATKERALGRPDVRIMLDRDYWAKIPSDQRAALMDHELNHIIVLRTPDGDIKTDEYQRPKLKMRLHDHEFGWFDKIAQRHGKSSIEVMSATKFMEEVGTVYVQADMFAQT